MSYLHDYPYNTLSPVWGLIAQAATKLRQHGPSLSIKHVKSHQDDDTPEDQLDLFARALYEAFVRYSHNISSLYISSRQTWLE
eukprot:13300031-Ditylum_brightwellii.AAC.1